MIEIGAVASANTNLVTGQNVPAAEASWPNVSGHNGVPDVEMSFGDFLDMVNPLQHIPVVSSIYRAIAGDNINPVSRVAGDALYGGALGIASAGLSAIGAIGDELVSAGNKGDGISGTVLASLFGKDSKDSTTATGAQDTQLALAAGTAMAGGQTPIPATTTALQTPVPEAAPAPVTDPGVIQLAEAPAGTKPGMQLDRSKLPYGGVMDSSMVASAQQTQSLALAMAGQNGILQAQRTLRDSRFATANANAAPLPVPATDAAAVTAQQAAQADPQTQVAMQNLIKELQAMKKANQYKNALQTAPAPGSSINITN